MLPDGLQQDQNLALYSISVGDSFPLSSSAVAIVHEHHCLHVLSAA